jgi:hypothetical protein
METAKIAPMAVHFAPDDASQDVTGQIFAVRANEIFLMSQTARSAPCTAPRAETPETIAEQAMPAMRAQFYALDRSQDVFSWDPI